ncbi:hypothetical protein VNO80_32044 [Phaseolus coccineus]|uniref:Uncharacterized protein n=1 Tax=Phaseolus coccineus TaxID=3886 RepID=A0AAN9L1F0_PHACN
MPTQGSADVAFRTPLAPYEKSKSLGSGGNCSGPHARYTDVFNESIALADRPGKRESSARVDYVLRPLYTPPVRSYRLNGPVKCSDCGDVGGPLPATCSTRECVSNTQRTTAGARPPVCVVERAGGRLGASGRKPVSPDKTLTPAPSCAKEYEAVR